VVRQTTPDAYRALAVSAVIAIGILIVGGALAAAAGFVFIAPGPEDPDVRRTQARRPG
jgi:hypothetical protein